MSLGVQAAPAGQDGSLARLVLMHDKEGKVLALLPATTLLNLANVWKLTGRQLQPVKGADAERFFGQEAVQTANGFRKLAQLPLLVDEGCLQYPTLQVNEPFSSTQWDVSADLLKDAQHGKLATAPAEIALQAPQGDDEEVITSAVKKFTKLRIQQRLEDTLGLPSMSPTTQKILMLRSDPDAEIEDLVEVVRVDPSLSAQVMSWAASPYYAAPGEVSSIEDAVSRVLGFELVVNMALGTAMGQMLNVPANGPRGGTPYWLQAVYCATLSEKLCKQIPLEKRPKPGLAYLSGLLHNFGYLLLAHLFPPQFALLSRYIEANPHFSLEAIEQQVINVTREQIGGWLLSSWALPAEVCDAIRYQNQLEHAGDNAAYVKLLYLANRLLRQKGLSDGPLEDVSDELLADLGLSRKVANDTLKELLNDDAAIRELTKLLEGGRS